jgi:predicted kinase
MYARYLTKSRFNLAMECPTKLYYSGKAEYADHKLQNPFLSALAEGGFQIGELAKCYFRFNFGNLVDVHQISTLNYDEALEQTAKLLQNDEVIIFEAAFRYENLFIRVDILRKYHNKIELIEVKAKSFDSESDSFLNKNGELSSKWYPYLLDVAFQKFVLQRALPEYEIAANLVLVDKNTRCPTDGLNQKFRIEKDRYDRKRVVVSDDLNPEDLSEPLLCQINVDDLCELIYRTSYPFLYEERNFFELIRIYENAYLNDIKIPPLPSRKCAGCEFRATEEELAHGLRCGFLECWSTAFDLNVKELAEPTVLELWNYRKKDQLINEKRIFLRDIVESDINPKPDGKSGLSTSERQWLQILKAQAKDTSWWIDRDNLIAEMRRWVYPLHFIDFETAMMAIPFSKGRRPYEGIAFQFSHHVVHEDGFVEHRGQYLNPYPGFFPNYEFIRRLKMELEQDQGSIFCYAPHENSFLNLIYQQLQDDPEYIEDREELCNFIRSITHSKEWVGERDMIDMLQLVKRYYYDPAMKGSNSIKVVLPAILNSSEFLQYKYSQPIYGAEGGIPSHNFKNWRWIRYENGMVVDPYKLLPKMFADVSDKEHELLSDSDEIKEGGAATTAYARMQFEEMSDYERAEITNALLKYCELDTMAMVMIYEGWLDLLGL